jgi:hypothetical protein
MSIRFSILFLMLLVVMSSQLIQQEYKWDALKAPIPRRYGP